MYHRLASEVTSALQGSDMLTIESVEAEVLLSAFLRRVVRNKSLRKADALELLKREIAAVVQDGEVLNALSRYKEAGTRPGSCEKDGYGPLIQLCNKTLDVLQGKSVRPNLDRILKKQPQQIEFLRYDNIYLSYDWNVDGKRELAPIKPDILLTFKDAISEYRNSQEAIKLKRTGDNSPFDSGDVPQSDRADTKATSKIRLRDVLTCVEVKWRRAPKQDPSASQIHDSKAGSSDGYVERHLDQDEQQQIILNSLSDEGGTSGSERSSGHHKQLGQYAAHLLSRGIYATHCIGIKLDYDTVQFCWFDRQNVIATREFNIFSNFPLFVAFITTLSRFSLEDWGIEEQFYPKGDRIEATIGGASCALTIRIDTTTKPLCHRVCLLGRGTMVLRGDIIDDDTVVAPVAVKLSYPEIGRIPEPEFIRLARERKRNKLQEHFPLVYLWDNLPYVTGTIREHLQRGEKGQARQRRIIVFELLESFSSLNNSNDVGFAWADCVFVHREMWEAGFEHGDLSLSNLMCRRKQGEIVGILADWDLATMRGPGQDVVIGGGNQRTGTTPFAALDMIDRKPRRRRYRHDLESFGWTLGYKCLDLDHPDNLEPIRRWHGFETTVAERELFIREMRRYKIRPGFEDLYRFAEMFLSWLVYEVAGRRPIARFPSITPGDTMIEFSDLRRERQMSSWPPQVKDDWKEPSEKEVWSMCYAMLKKKFFQKESG